MRIAFVVPWQEPGRWVWSHLPGDGPEADLLSAAPKPTAFWNQFLRLPPYVSEFWYLACLRPHFENYNVVFAWELRTTVAVALLQKFRPAGKRAKFVPVGPIVKGSVLSVLLLVRWLLKDAARIVCFSRAECDTQAALLNLPRERFVFVPTLWDTTARTDNSEGDYILALGHSARDYPTLLKAVRDTGLSVILCAKERSDLGSGEIPQNVSVRFRTGNDETTALVARAVFHVIPLRDTDHSAGQSVLLRAMAAGKAVIVSETAGIRDYVEDGKTAVLVPPGDAPALRAVLLDLWGNAEKRKRIGENASESVRSEFSAAQFAARILTIAEDLTD